jgi:LysM repeat protein/ribosomal protein L40E
MKKTSFETSTQKKNNICPVCGTRLSDNATRCLVCGTQLGSITASPKTRSLDSGGLPEIRLKLPGMIILALVFLALVATIVALLVSSKLSASAEDAANIEGSRTPTATVTLTVTPTFTATPEPTWTPLPPVAHTVGQGEQCLHIALQYNTSVQAIILENRLDANCTVSEGQILMVPLPTYTPSPVPSATPEEILEEERCTNVMPITVTGSDTLSSIAANYSVTMKDIMDHNGMSNDVVRVGQALEIPLCYRLPTPGPTPTATPVPPYPGPNLLLPRSGAYFPPGEEGVTLQWASVADLYPNELYRVIVKDLTSTDERTLVEYVTDTKFILPSSFRPTDATPHIIQWTVSVARRINDDPANPIYEEAGVLSEPRVFIWSSANVQP